MLIPAKIQIDEKKYEFIKQSHKKLHYKSLSEYIRAAIDDKVEKDRKRLRDLKRISAIEMIGKVPYDNVFESIEGEDFERR